MDISKIGNYIASRRKEKGLTQAALAETLHITDKAVRKWERGLSLPDITLLEPLATLLDISVAELLNGESLRGEDIPKEIADNLITASSTLYTVRAAKKSKSKTILFALLLLIISFLFLFGFHYAKTQKDLAAVSTGYHAVCDNVGELYDELTDKTRSPLFRLKAEEYTSALFFAGGADALLRESSSTMQNYPQLYRYAEELRQTTDKIHEFLDTAEKVGDSYVIDSSCDYEKLIAELYDQYHGFIDSYEELRKNASISGKKAF